MKTMKFLEVSFSVCVISSYYCESFHLSNEELFKKVSTSSSGNLVIGLEFFLSILCELRLDLSSSLDCEVSLFIL